jgi:hypothetical protein
MITKMARQYTLKLLLDLATLLILIPLYGEINNYVLTAFLIIPLISIVISIIEIFPYSPFTMVYVFVVGNFINIPPYMKDIIFNLRLLNEEVRDDKNGIPVRTKQRHLNFLEVTCHEIVEVALFGPRDRTICFPPSRVVRTDKQYHISRNDAISILSAIEIFMNDIKLDSTSLDYYIDKNQCFKNKILWKYPNKNS